MRTVITPEHYEVVVGFDDGTARRYLVIADSEAEAVDFIAIKMRDEGTMFKRVVVKLHRLAHRARFEVAGKGV